MFQSINAFLYQLNKLKIKLHLQEIEFCHLNQEANLLLTIHIFMYLGDILICEGHGIEACLLLRSLLPELQCYGRSTASLCESSFSFHEQEMHWHVSEMQKHWKLTYICVI